MSETSKERLLRFASEEAAKAWCTKETEGLVMIPELAKAFAKILAKSFAQARLGNATTRALLEEIKVRIEIDGNLDYRTVDSD